MHYFITSVVIIVYLAFCWHCWWRHRRQQQKLRGHNINDHNVGEHSSGGNKLTRADIIVGYASQTGAAAVFASRSVQQLRDAGKDATLLPLNQLTPKLLSDANTLLIIASTYGEGEAPDNGNRFIPHCLTTVSERSFSAKPLEHLQVAVLGLGDSTYRFFCGFAHKLHHELHVRGARLLTDVVEVDRLDESALRHWQYYLGQISGKPRYNDWSRPAYDKWTILSRECINNGSPGAPVFHIRLAPIDREISEIEWQAGDVAEIGPGNSDQKILYFLRQLGRDAIPLESLRYCNLQLSAERFEAAVTMDDDCLTASLTELPHREYSIASVPTEKTLDLLVRQISNEAGQLGLGSGWLTAHSRLDQHIRLRVRSNSHFHSPTTRCPLILIGNGTGIAGLRAHLANPSRAGTRNWLLFGERKKTADQFFIDDLRHWQNTGLLNRMDLVFSRDANNNEPRYVQDLLPSHAHELQQWVAEGAAIFVCGSLKGMAQAVDDSLREILGAELLEQMTDERRYCRDVY